MWPWLLLGLVAFFMVGSKALAYNKGKPVEIDLAPIGGGFYLRADAARAFVAMRNAASNDGIALIVTSAFRSMSEQQSLFDKYQSGSGNLAAKPGYSNHQSGVAVDSQVGSSFSSPAYLWLSRNASRFRFVNTGAAFSQREPWHLEYV